jgi:hypothetical protein
MVTCLALERSFVVVESRRDLSVRLSSSLWHLNMSLMQGKLVTSWDNIAQLAPLNTFLDDNIAGTLVSLHDMVASLATFLRGPMDECLNKGIKVEELGVAKPHFFPLVVGLCDGSSEFDIHSTCGIGGPV